MIVGLDFDNTIACYDQAIARLSKEILDLPANVPPTKLGVRDHLRAAGREPEWTAFQGHLYGPGMNYAEPFPKAVETIAALQDKGHKTLIISHRTRHPYAGPQFDLHASAKSWILDKLVLRSRRLFPESHVFFNESRGEKIALIRSLACDVFLDDLPDVLEDAHFPSTTKKLWFSKKSPPTGSDVIQITHWNEVEGHCAE